LKRGEAWYDLPPRVRTPNRWRGAEECRSRNPALLPVQEYHPLLLKRVEELLPTDAFEVFPIWLAGKIYTQRSLTPNHPRGLSTVFLCPPADFTVVRGAPVVHWGPLSWTSQQVVVTPPFGLLNYGPSAVNESPDALNTEQGAISSGGRARPRVGQTTRSSPLVRSYEAGCKSVYGSTPLVWRFPLPPGRGGRGKDGVRRLLLTGLRPSPLG